MSTKNKPVSHGKNDEMIRRNSQKYDDVMKSRREELRRKRGALELNSDLDFEAEFKSQRPESHLPPALTSGPAPGVSASHDRVNFKSKLHQQIK